MSGLLLRLAGPLQSWGEHSAFSERDTLGYPTRSGLLGLIAAAYGIPRGRSLGRLTELRLTVRIDHPGVRIVDFHTIGGGLPREQTVQTADGKRQPSATATIVTRRHYLADAAFAVAVSGDVALIDQVAAKLNRPVWQPYLGRRSCPPEQPLVIGGVVDDPVAELEERLPLTRLRPRDGDTVDVDFVYDSDERDDGMRTVLADDCDEFTRHDRRYRSRPLSVISQRLPAELCLRYPKQSYLDRLAAYLEAAT